MSASLVELYRSPYRGAGAGAVAVVVDYAVVDAADLDLLGQYRWYLAKPGKGRRGGNYPTATVGGRPLTMHRLLVPAPDGYVVDHINRDGLDNRRSNLRVITPAQNMQNRRSRVGATSSFRGVYWAKNEQKWRAQVKVEGIKFCLGSYDSEEDAAKAASSFRQRYVPLSYENGLT